MNGQKNKSQVLTNWKCPLSYRIYLSNKTKERNRGCLLLRHEYKAEIQGPDIHVEIARLFDRLSYFGHFGARENVLHRTLAGKDINRNSLLYRKFAWSCGMTMAVLKKKNSHELNCGTNLVTIRSLSACVCFHCISTTAKIRQIRLTVDCSDGLGNPGWRSGSCTLSQPLITKCDPWWGSFSLGQAPHQTQLGVFVGGKPVEDHVLAATLLTPTGMLYFPTSSYLCLQ